MKQSWQLITAKIDVALRFVDPPLPAVNNPWTVSQKSIENLHDSEKYAWATAFCQNLAAITIWACDQQLEVDLTDDIEENESPADTISYVDLHIAKRAVEPEGLCLSTAFLTFGIAATTYQIHVPER